jgi:CAAX prenyl protease-like protein
MSFKTRLFLILWVAGLAGILSFLLVDLSALLASLPVTTGKEMPFPPLIIKLLSMIQPTVLMSLAVFVGVLLARQVGLSAPAAEAAAGGRQITSALKPQIVPGAVGGVVGGIAIVLTWLLWKPFLPPEFVTRAEELNKFLPFLTRLLYGGITEELLIRWGVMTFLVWAAWRLLQRGQGRPRAICFVSAIVISSILFGIGHLPVASALGIGLTSSIVFYVVIANSLFGLIAGYLYWKKGLEAAILAHMMAHVVLKTAIHFGT